MIVGKLFGQHFLLLQTVAKCLQSVDARQIAMADASVFVLACHVQLCVVALTKTDLNLELVDHIQHMIIYTNVFFLII